MTASADIPRFRFAPSPNGYLHLGHVYSALQVWDAATAAGAPVLLRIEDIDTGRAREAFVAAIFEDLTWLGFDWAPNIRRQSEHFSDYEAALETLKALNVVYPCFCTRRQIREAVANAGSTAPPGGMGPIYPGTCRGLDPHTVAARIAAGDSHAWRLNIRRALSILPGSATLDWHDGRLGPQPVAVDTLDDAILDRKDTRYSYHLSVVVDDAQQGITDVVRGTDLLAATPLHILLQRLLALPTPHYRHHALVADTDAKKLSKSRGAPGIRTLRAAGHSASAVLAMARAAVASRE